jgi:hypothetical protein
VPRLLSRLSRTTRFPSVDGHEPAVDRVIWALLKRRRGRVHHLH